MEAVQEVRMKLLIQTDKRIVEQEFENIFDLRIFMDRFFSQMSETESARVKGLTEGAKKRQLA